MPTSTTNPPNQFGSSFLHSRKQVASSEGREPGNKARKQAHVIQIWIIYHSIDKPSTFKEKIYIPDTIQADFKVCTYPVQNFTTKPLLVQVHYAVIEFFTKNAD